MKIIFFTTSFIAVLLVGCSKNQLNNETILAKQNTSAVLWVQNSSEYLALMTQAFNIAKDTFDRADNIPGKKKAVVVDLDETILNSTPYDAQLIKSGELSNRRNWGEWVSKEKSSPIPGAVHFVNYIINNGGEIFYVSNRKSDAYQHTMNNLIKNGFPHVSEKTLLLRDKMANKQHRFNTITASGYNIVVFIGDNLNDFGDIFYRKKDNKRKELVMMNAPNFGYKFILMPNPIYGSWENVLTDSYSGLNLNEKIEARNKLINDKSYK
ncbi:5'-nucleotidase, lipoprotein e(P4) family [Xenorhabdus sp. Flor]|uniref:5'-nucleotidase, lipoprotein e(P4) family n=1 Tax=Xenorhabdus cabanillasii TaxID=351673 RepID=UPI0019C1317C|nr:5'-nucleotidase, lipoprotein e(P4) family [Xenorhabdus sp. Flor]MBD2816056.1 5'-nucleotidase, lipoprotein e(P4) family [Xenorhabdus sp. Flor]